MNEGEVHESTAAGDAQEWQEALVMVMHQLGIVEIRIKPDTIKELSERTVEKQPFALVYEKDGGFHVVVTTREAMEPSRIARVN